MACIGFGIEHERRAHDQNDARDVQGEQQLLALILQDLVQQGERAEPSLGAQQREQPEQPQKAQDVPSLVPAPVGRRREERYDEIDREWHETNQVERIEWLNAPTQATSARRGVAWVLNS